MKQEMRVGIDQPGKQCHPGELDDARCWISDITRRSDGGDAVTTHEDDPAFSKLWRNAIEDAGRTQQNGRRRTRSVRRTLRAKCRGLE
jgi:hypothetical protein